MNGHKPMKQVASRTETSNGCVVTYALKATSPEKTKQKDNKEVTDGNFGVGAKQKSRRRVS